ncbi:MAG: hypothetical protein IKS98_08400 [Lachnospiraceae bacterium]|nr:hypothetical protein [Lachnospiraceae bacterium]
MAVNMFGNINGTYQPPQINVFDLAKEQNNKPIRFRDTEAGKDMPAVTVNISSEGLRALHGTKFSGSIDIGAEQEKLRYASEHQPVESFRSRLSRELQQGTEQLRADNPYGKVSVEDKEEILMKSFRDIADEIVAGHDNGTRVRFIEDPDSEDGYRRLSKDDELSILQQDFEKLAEARFGKKQQEAAAMVTKQMEELHKVLERSGKSFKQPECQPERISDDFLERILERARLHIAGLK